VYQPEQLKSDIMNPSYWIERVMKPWNYPPDIVVYVQISVDTALERADKEEKYENQKMLTAVKENYEALVAEQIESTVSPEYIVVDGEQPKSDMVREAVTALDVRLDE
jgi:dTMP kinase